MNVTANNHQTSYAGNTPWYGLSRELPPQMAFEDWMREGGLDWTVSLRPMTYIDFKGETRESGHFALTRDDSGFELDVTGKKYVPMQNAQVLEFFREYVETGDMELETAGFLQNGRHVWALARMNASYMLRGIDEVGGYVLLTNPHQYGRSAVLKFTEIRKVCSNTLTSSLARKGGLKIWHNAEFNDTRRGLAKERLGIARERLDEGRAEAEALVDLRVSDEDAIRLFAKQFNANGVDKPFEEQSRTVRHLVDLFKGDGVGAKLETADGTGWGVLNAVTQYLDWEYGRTADARLTHAWIGGGEATKREVKDALLLETPMAQLVAKRRRTRNA